MMVGVKMEMKEGRLKRSWIGLREECSVVFLVNVDPPLRSLLHGLPILSLLQHNKRHTRSDESKEKK